MDQDRQARIGEAFNKLFRTYPQSARDKDKSQADAARELMERAKVYYEAVAPYEAQDVEAAVNAFLTGQVAGHNPAFAPTAPQIGSATRRAMDDRLDRLRRWRLANPRLPAPDVPKDDESRKRVLAKAAAAAEMLEQVTHAMSSTSDADRRMFAEKVAERFDPDPNGYATQERLLRRWVVGDADGQEDAA